MKKMVLLVLLSVMSVGVEADSAHAIFGGRAWRVNYRRNGAGFFRVRRSVYVKPVGPASLQEVRDAFDIYGVKPSENFQKKIRFFNSYLEEAKLNGLPH